MVSFSVNGGSAQWDGCEGLVVYAKGPVTKQVSINKSFLSLLLQVRILTPNYFFRLGYWKVCVDSLCITVLLYNTLLDLSLEMEVMIEK